MIFDIFLAAVGIFVSVVNIVIAKNMEDFKSIASMLFCYVVILLQVTFTWIGVAALWK